MSQKKKSHSYMSAHLRTCVLFAPTFRKDYDVSCLRFNFHYYDICRVVSISTLTNKYNRIAHTVSTEN